MKSRLFDKVVAFLQRLDEANIAYSLKHNRPEAITVTVDIPGERWEIDFLADGEVDVQRFVSNGDIRDEKVLEELFDVEEAKAGRRLGGPSQISEERHE